ncbi:hypothetical protein F5050DRAFT_1549907, partial [Lentinula boryana]
FTPDRDAMTDFQEIEPEPIRAADGRSFTATGKGDMVISFPMKGNAKRTTVTLKDVLYSPNMSYTLISVIKLDRAGCSLQIEDGFCTI